MKKLRLKALDLGASELLSREQLKNVLGGDGSGNPNCNGVEGTDDWYCCNGTPPQHLGIMTCNQASSLCNGYKITNDASRCN